MEWEAFERDMQSSSRPVVGAADGGDGGGGGGEATTGDDPQGTYARATIAAEPELVVPSLVGLPQDPASGEDAGGGGGRQAVVAMSEEEEKRKRKEMDERELIMDRLVEEERAQEDAYSRVALLRNKVQMLKQKRQLAKAKGQRGGP
jgi:zinc finger protein 830